MTGCLHPTYLMPTKRREPIYNKTKKGTNDMKKIIILLTLLAMLLTFCVSCANGSNNGSGSDTVATSQASAADSGTAEETAAPRHYPRC